MTRRINTAPPSTTPVMSDSGGFAGSNPVDGQELMAAWELPPDAWQTTTVKTVRPRPGTRIEEIVNSCPLPEWNLDDLAARFGPGTYRVAPGPGPYRTKTATIHVSDEYARACGWGAAPPAAPKAQELVAARTLQQAAAGPTNPLDLMAMIETMMDRREAALLARLTPQQQGGGPEAMMAMMMKGFELSTQMIRGSMETARTLTTPAEPREPATLADVLLQMGPQILGTIQQAMATAPARQAPPVPHRPAPPPTAGTLPPATPAPAAPPEPEPTMRNISEETRAAVGTLTEQENQAIAPAVGMFEPYAGRLVPFLGTTHPSILAAQVAGYIGPEMVDSVQALAVVAETRPAILGLIHDRLASPEGLELVRSLAAKLEEIYPSDEA